VTFRVRGGGASEQKLFVLARRLQTGRIGPLGAPVLKVWPDIGRMDFMTASMSSTAGGVAVDDAGVYLQQQRRQPDDRRSDDPASIASLRTDLALARSEIARLRADNDKLRCDQHDGAELLARVDTLVAENRALTAKLQRSTTENVGLRRQITEMEEDIAGARTALRRMIREQTTGLSSGWERLVRPGCRFTC
jgi:hypothetical protein